MQIYNFFKVDLPCNHDFFQTEKTALNIFSEEKVLSFNNVFYIAEGSLLQGLSIP